MEEAGKDTKADEEMLTIASKLEEILKEEVSNKDDDENINPVCTGGGQICPPSRKLLSSLKFRFTNPY